MGQFPQILRRTNRSVRFTDYTVPKLQNSWSTHSLGDYFGLPINSSLAASSLPFRAYNHIFNEWYRDQNLVDSADYSTSDAGDIASQYTLRKRGKRHDYFTSCLPWPQKGDSVQLPLGSQAPITTDATASQHLTINSTNYNGERELRSAGQNSYIHIHQNALNGESLYADLSSATASTVNELRRSFQIQKLLERDARSGTRYSEIVNAHFGVNFMDVTYLSLIHI